MNPQYSEKSSALDEELLAINRSEQDLQKLVESDASPHHIERVVTQVLELHGLQAAPLLDVA